MECPDDDADDPPTRGGASRRRSGTKRLLRRLLPLQQRTRGTEGSSHSPPVEELAELRSSGRREAETTTWSPGLAPPKFDTETWGDEARWPPAELASLALALH
ncbi:unnamed protein product [Lampetra planeri]